jgi:hypothetical protein
VSSTLGSPTDPKKGKHDDHAFAFSCLRGSLREIEQGLEPIGGKGAIATQLLAWACSASFSQLCSPVTERMFTVLVRDNHVNLTLKARKTMRFR